MDTLPLMCPECLSNMVTHGDPPWSSENGYIERTLSCRCECGHQFKMVETMFDDAPGISEYSQLSQSMKEWERMDNEARAQVFGESWSEEDEEDD